MKAICVLIALSLSLMAQAQVRIEKGISFPADPHTNTWFHNTESDTVYTFKNAAWKSVAVDVDSIYACGEITVLQWPDYYFVFYPGNVLAYLSLENVWCGDSIIIAESLWDVYCWDHHATQLALLEKTNVKSRITAIQFQGMDAFCLPRILEDMPYQSFSAIRTWGILGTNGKWLIEPKYDAPFRFQNGFADVVYYGQKRKINEKGEFVE